MGIPLRENPNFREERGGGGQRAESAPGSQVLSLSPHCTFPRCKAEVGRRVGLPKGQFLV